MYRGGRKESERQGREGKGGERGTGKGGERGTRPALCMEDPDSPGFSMRHLL